MGSFGMPHDIPRGIPHEGCGGTFILSRDAIHKGLWGHLKCDKCGEIRDTLDMGIDHRDMPGWDTDLSHGTRSANKGRTHHGPHYAGCGCADDPSPAAKDGRAYPKRRRPVVLPTVLMAVTVLGLVWWFGFDHTDVGDAIYGGIADLSEHGGAALDGISDVALDSIDGIAGGASVALDGISDAAQAAADMVDESRSDGSAAGGSAAGTPESQSGDTEPITDTVADPIVEPTDEPHVDGPPADTQDTPQPSPLDRTIYPDGSTHGSVSGTAPAVPDPEPTHEPEPHVLTYGWYNEAALQEYALDADITARGIHAGFAAWSELNPDLQFAYSPPPHNIRIAFLPPDHPYLGTACMNCIESGKLYVQPTTHCAGKQHQYESAIIRDTVAHEIGHMLGLRHHVSMSHLMYGHGYTTYGGDWLDLGYSIPRLLVQYTETC